MNEIQVFDGLKAKEENGKFQGLFDKAQQAGLSDSQLYKQAGNSVTVNVIEYIGNLLKERE